MINSSKLTELRQHFRTLLQEELCLSRFSEEEGGDYVFHYEGMRVRMCFDADDSAYLWIGRTLYWAKNASAEDLATVDRCMSEVNHRYKVVKLSRSPKPDREGDYAVQASASFLVEDLATTSSAALERYLNLIKAGSRLFWDLHKAATKEDKQLAPRIETGAGVAVRH